MQITGTGPSMQTLDTLKFYFYFCGKEYSVTLNILPAPTPLNICHKDMDDVSLNYQKLHKTIESLKDCFTEKVEIRNYLAFLLFAKYDFISRVRLRNIHRNLDNPSVENQMRVIENDELKNLPSSTRKKLANTVK